jgi:hypothetical protein
MSIPINMYFSCHYLLLPPPLRPLVPLLFEVADGRDEADGFAEALLPLVPEALLALFPAPVLESLLALLPLLVVEGLLALLL